MSAVLRVAELACGYGETRILSGLSLDVAPGEVLALIGPNGSGKTTLLHTLAGLLPPQAGDVAWDGRSLLALGRRERARVVALAPQRAEEAACGGLAIESGDAAEAGGNGIAQAGDDERFATSQRLAWILKSTSLPWASCSASHCGNWARGT